MKIDGREIADKILADLKTRVGELKKKNITPTLAILLVGSDPASISYTNQKKETLEKIGGKAKIYKISPTSNDESIISLIEKIQGDKKLNGLILQLPLPKKFNEEKILRHIDPTLDIDGFLPNSHFMPPIAKAVQKILTTVFLNSTVIPVQTGILNSIKDFFYRFPIKLGMTKNKYDFSNWLKSKKITVIGKGETGGLPIINWLKSNNINPNIIDSKTENRDDFLKSSDIIISAVGKENFKINSDQIKNGVVLIGVGLRQERDGKFIGDYNSLEIKDKAAFYTATLGGVGPVNVASLMENLIESAEK